MGCSEHKTPVILEFSPVFEGKSIECKKAIDIHKSKWIVNQFQFYVSDVELQDKEARWHKAVFKVTPEQTENVALLGTTCQASESENWKLFFKDSNELAYTKAIRFSLGVPFEQNHLNPLEQPSPLNVSSMFWVWQTGHKFARIEMMNGSEDWIFHLGSTGCKSASVMRAPNDACLYPNLYSIELPLNQSNRVAIDLANLLGNIAPSIETSCQSEQDNLACQTLFAHLTQKGDSAVFRTPLND